MNVEAFLKAYREFRNGTDRFHFNPLYRRFKYSDGVKECAEAGCYWLLDILGTELPDEFLKREGEHLCTVTVEVLESTGAVMNRAVIRGEFVDDDPNPYTRAIDYTDLPAGRWDFLVTFDGDDFFCILLTEY